RQWLRQLTLLEEHNGTVFRSLVHSLLKPIDGTQQASTGDPGTGKPNAAEMTEAVNAGLSAIYADMHAPASHVAYALALEASARQADAVRAFEAALVAPGSDGDR